MVLQNKGWLLVKVFVFIISLLPFFSLLQRALLDQLGANPVQTLHYGFGDWALRFLCIGLALSPIKRITGQSWPNKFRRMLGLFAFFYASCHFLVFIVLDLSLSWQAFTDEVPKSPYILMGLLTFVLLIPLAATSTTGMQRRLGASWKKLHRLVYLAAITASIHYFWLVKADYREPILYGLLILFLLGYRVMVVMITHTRKSQWQQHRP
jgi:methionine sulfoxide reductase heme-binding subunit